MLSHRIGKISFPALVAASALALPLAMSDGAQAGPSCYGYYTAQANGSSRSYALNAAIGAWSYWVASHYGKAYSNWNYAQYKSTWCSQYGYSWTCYAKAEPCYYAPPSYTPSYKPSYRPHPYSGGGGSGY